MLHNTHNYEIKVNRKRTWLRKLNEHWGEHEVEKWSLIIKGCKPETNGDLTKRYGFGNGVMD